MIKILINEEEVVSNSNLQIKEEMLSTSSTILKNCYPKSWENDKDYTSRYYFPKDYSKCEIYKTTPINFDILGESNQNGTPTPDNPVPIINKTGNITEEIEGKEYHFDLGNIELCKIGEYQDKITKGPSNNLLDTSLGFQNGYLNTSGVFVAQNQTALFNQDIDVESGETYCFSTNQNIDNIVISMFKENGTFKSRTKISNTNKIVQVIPSDVVMVKLAINYNNSATMTQEIIDSLEVMVEHKNNRSATYEPFGEGWYIEKQIGKVILNGTESWTGSIAHRFYITQTSVGLNTTTGLCDRFEVKSLTSSNSITFYASNIYIYYNQISGTNNFKTWLSNNNTTIYGVLKEAERIKITDANLLEQLNNAGETLIFCGCVKNTGKISLNPREPHFCDLQILDFKTLLSEGDCLNYVISNKTIIEAINQVVSSISEYGFVVGNIQILNPNEVIGAYSTLNKTAYDVFQYFADITQSRWSTRMIDENSIAIDFYDPTLMPVGTQIQSTTQFYEDNDIVDISFNYSTNDYRNKQIMTSDEVFANITQTQTFIADGYTRNFICENKLGIISNLTLNGIEQTFITKNEEKMGYSGDFIYQPGETTLISSNIISAGGTIVITYYPIVKGREIIINSTEASRIGTQIGRKGTISRYENRNDSTSSVELQKIGQSYIKYKGQAEITLKVISTQDLWDIGEIVNYDAPLDELSTDYMIKSKIIDMYLNADKIFYTYELTSNFNYENAVNYFDNQRAKNQGNIGEGETITRNIDIENTALIKFYDTVIEETSVQNPTSLDFALDGVLI